MFSNARYVSILAVVRSGSEAKPSGCLGITAFSADYQSADPVTRDSTPLWGSPAAVDYYMTLQTFWSFFNAKKPKNIQTQNNPECYL